jgi:hypothetical protein
MLSAEGQNRELLILLISCNFPFINAFRRGAEPVAVPGHHAIRISGHLLRQVDGKKA